MKFCIFWAVWCKKTYLCCLAAKHTHFPHLTLLENHSKAKKNLILFLKTRTLSDWLSRKFIIKSSSICKWYKHSSFALMHAPILQTAFVKYFVAVICWIQLNSSRIYVLLMFLLFFMAKEKIYLAWNFFTFFLSQRPPTPASAP